MELNLGGWGVVGVWEAPKAQQRFPVVVLACELITSDTDSIHHLLVSFYTTLNIVSQKRTSGFRVTASNGTIEDFRT